MNDHKKIVIVSMQFRQQRILLTLYKSRFMKEMSNQAPVVVFFCGGEGPAWLKKLAVGKKFKNTDIINPGKISHIIH